MQALSPHEVVDITLRGEFFGTVRSVRRAGTHTGGCVYLRAWHTCLLTLVGRRLSLGAVPQALVTAQVQ